MTSLRMTWRSVELTLATALLILGLFALFAAPSHAASCDASLYVTGDMVGDGNPAEVYAALCGYTVASSAPPA